uniref:N-acetyltransferase domain-containing protein n=1 Tax=Arcella intermedia TaxID=1963864 RepID=A0A6B2LNT0_9EUKA
MPVIYHDKFYAALLLKNDQFTHLAFFNDIFVGAICSRIEKDETTGELKLYIMTLAVLAPYRRFGIGKKLLDMATEQIKNKKIPVKEIYLNVQTSNETAIEFYKKMGFVITREQKDYYKNIEPPHAYFLSKNIQ